jgi:DNA-binding transcriptional MerR regulator
MTIGEAADRAGVTAKAIRLYESKGLIEPVSRTAAGYRTYNPDDVAVLRFIRQAKAVGLKLDEVGRIIDLQRSGQQPCSTVIDLLDLRLADIDAKLTDLRRLRRTLSDARSRADAAARSGADAVIGQVIESTASA